MKTIGTVKTVREEEDEEERGERESEIGRTNPRRVTGE